VQTALTDPGTLEHFFPDSPEKVAALRGTFMELFDAMDVRADAVVRDRVEVEKWILKPSLEGGGHGVFGGDIPGFLEGLTHDERGKYIFMRRIEAPITGGMLMSSQGLYEGGTVSELQIFGSCLWMVAAGEGRVGSGGGTSEVNFVWSANAGWSLKTKAEHIKEMSVVKGYGCFDSPLLMDEEQYRRLGKVVSARRVTNGAVG